jgi:DNA-damage-inducible protein J
MIKTATVHARIDPETKKRSEEILHALGMTPTDAVRLLYKQIAIRKEFPLELRVPNKTTLATFAKTDRGEEIESYGSLDELIGSWEEE